MASPKANYLIDITGSVIPATEGTATYNAFLMLQDCNGRTYQTFRDLAGGPKGTPARAFSPSSIMKDAEAAGFARLVPPETATPSEETSSGENEASGAPSRWSDDELRAALFAYLEVLSLELAGEQTNKAEVNRRLRAGPLMSRSAPSVEYRMQNISAFFISKGIATVQGYKPASNVGAKVMMRLEALWQQLPRLEAYAPTDDEEELASRAKQLLAGTNITIAVGAKHPRSFQCTTKLFKRSPAVVAYVLKKANGTCEACFSPAPFSVDDGSCFLEVHHVTPLSAGGPDTVDNAVAVCPNCHRAFHHSVDRHERTSSIIEKVSRLQDYRATD